MTVQEEDFLSVDTPIPGQNFACISFVSPEKVLNNKNTFFIHEYLKSKAEEYNLSLEKLEEDYDGYLYNNRDKLEKTFYEKNDFHTSIRGLKVRGVYDTKREADVRAKVLQRKDENFHVFVGQVGYWLPWDPEADDIENEEYAENELNKLVKNYNENRKKRDVYFDDQKKEKIEKINKEKILKKKEIENSEDDNLFKNEDDPWMKKNDINKEKEISQLLVSLLDNNMIPHNGPYDEYKEKIKGLLTTSCNNSDEQLQELMKTKLTSIGWCENPDDDFYNNLKKNLEIKNENNKNNKDNDLPSNIINIDN